MVDIEFGEEPTAAEIERALSRIRPAGAMPRGIAGGRALDYDAEAERLTVDFDQLRRTLIEHRLFEEAEGFSSKELALLRILETGPDRMAFSEIKDKASDHEDLADLKPNTYQHHLRNLRDKNLVEHTRNQYTYVGP